MVRCFARLIFLQSVKGTIRRCFTGLTRDWKGNTERKSSKIPESGKCLLVALSSWWIILFLGSVLTGFEFWMFFPQVETSWILFMRMCIGTYSLILELHIWIQTCIAFCLEQKIGKKRLGCEYLLWSHFFNYFYPLLRAS